MIEEWYHLKLLKCTGICWENTEELFIILLISELTCCNLRGILRRQQSQGLSRSGRSWWVLISRIIEVIIIIIVCIPSVFHFLIVFLSSFNDSLFHHFTNYSSSYDSSYYPSSDESLLFTKDDEMLLTKLLKPVEGWIIPAKDWLDNAIHFRVIHELRLCLREESTEWVLKLGLESEGERGLLLGDSGDDEEGSVTRNIDETSTYDNSLFILVSLRSALSESGGDVEDSRFHFNDC